MIYNTNNKTGKPSERRMKNLKLTLKALRINKVYSQEKASNFIGISVETLANYEKGITYPDIPVLKKIEEVYETKYDNINFF